MGVATAARLLVLAQVLACGTALLRSRRHVHFDLGKAERILGQDVLAKLEADVKADKRCGHAANGTAAGAASRAPGSADQQQRDAYAEQKCAELCHGNAACIGVCGEVRMMLCAGGPDIVYVNGYSTGNSGAAAAAAATAATNAVKEAVQAAVLESQGHAKQAADAAKATMEEAVMEAAKITKLAAKEAAHTAAHAAATAAAKESSSNAHAIASTAAAAAAAAAQAKMGGGAAPAPAGAPAPGPAPAFL